MPRRKNYRWECPFPPVAAGDGRPLYAANFQAEALAGSLRRGFLCIQRNVKNLGLKELLTTPPTTPSAIASNSIRGRKDMPMPMRTAPTPAAEKKTRNLSVGAEQSMDGPFPRPVIVMLASTTLGFTRRSLTILLPDPFFFFVRAGCRQRGRQAIGRLARNDGKETLNSALIKTYAVSQICQLSSTRCSLPGSVLCTFKGTSDAWLLA